MMFIFYVLLLFLTQRIECQTTTVKTTLAPTTVKTTVAATTIKTTVAATTVKTTVAATTVKTTVAATTVKTTVAATTVKTTVPAATVKTTVPATTVKTTVAATTVKATLPPTTVKSTGAATTAPAATSAGSSTESGPDEDTPEPTDEPIDDGTGGGTDGGTDSTIACGKMQGTRKTQFQVIGGGPARVGNYPWQVVIARNRVPSCSGTVIAPNYVLTAAHCLTSNTVSDYLVVAGTNSKYNLKGQGTIQTVTKIIRHPQFNKKTFLANVALLQVTPSFDFNRKKSNGAGAIAPICLTAATQPVRVNTPAIVSGYGWTAARKSVAYLKAAKIKILPHANCARAFKGTNFYDSNSMVCAGSPNGGVDACYGDGGGPLSVFMNDAVTQVGITSHGYGCGRKGIPRIYMKVATFMPWIQTQINSSKKRRAKIQRKRTVKRKQNAKTQKKSVKSAAKKTTKKVKKTQRPQNSNNKSKTKKIIMHSI